MALLAFVLFSALGAVVGGIIAMPVMWVTKEFLAPIFQWNSREAASEVADVLCLLGVLAGLWHGFAMLSEPFWWVTRRGTPR